MFRWTITAHVWHGPHAVELRKYVVLAEDEFWALYTVKEWVLAPARGNAKRDLTHMHVTEVHPNGCSTQHSLLPMLDVSANR